MVAGAEKKRFPAYAVMVLVPDIEFGLIPMLNHEKKEMDFSE